MEICLNEYIRTKNGKIDKVINDNYYISEYIECEKGIVDKENIVNHSFKIKELIEEGDIVNESLIVYRGKVASGKEKLLVGNYIINGMSLEVANIKSILTHEQYERDCYRLEEE